jgi:hypothetical protein
MERPLPRLGDWLDTATVSRGRASTISNTTKQEWGLSNGHQRGPQLATSGDFFMATDSLRAIEAFGAD